MYAATDLVEVWRANAKVENAYTSRPDWDRAVRVWSGLASVQPDRSYEAFTPARDTSTDRLKVYLPYDAVVEATDRILISGFFYEVDGEPRRHSQTSRKHTFITAWRAVR